MLSLFSTVIPDSWKWRAWRIWDMKDTFYLLRKYANAQVAYQVVKIEMKVFQHQARRNR
jgi:hypothetical protein